MLSTLQTHGTGTSQRPPKLPGAVGSIASGDRAGTAAGNPRCDLPGCLKRRSDPNGLLLNILRKS